MFALAGACRAVTANGLTDPRGAFLDCKNPRRGSGGTPSFDSFGNRRTIERDFVNDDRLTERNATLELNGDFGAVSVKSITSYTNYRTLLGNDADYSRNPHAREWVKEENKSYTQELQLSSRTGKPLQSRLHVAFVANQFCDFLLCGHIPNDGRSISATSHNLFAIF